MSRLNSESINVLQILKDSSAEKIVQIFKSINGKKDLVLDKEIVCSLDYIANFTLLKTCGIEKVFKLESGPSPGQNQKCIYLIRPKIKNVKIISDHINANLSAGHEKKYWVVYVPQKLFSNERVLEREGVYGHVIQMEFPLGFVTLDKDLISLEISDFYESFFLRGDLMHIRTAALALVQLCQICGPVPKIFGQGRCAKMVIEMMELMQKESEFSTEIPADKISHLILLDRDMDYASVLLSQLTYEGVLDETFGINSGRIIFPKEVTGKEEPVKVVLNNSDAIYEEIKNAYFASVFGSLREKAKQLQSKSETSNMSIGAMRDFVTKEMKNICQQHTSLSLHIGACEVIMEKMKLLNFQERLQIERDIIEVLSSKESISYIEDIINRQEEILNAASRFLLRGRITQTETKVPYTSALRLMCLLSVAQGGLMASDYKSLVTQFCQSYGNQHLITFQNLKKAGLLLELPPLLSTKSSKMEKAASAAATKIAEKVVTAVAFPRSSSFKAITKKFDLIVDEEPADIKSPKNMNYVFGGAYVPLVGKITEQILTKDSSKTVDAMKLLPGPTVTKFQLDKDTGHIRPLKDFKSKTVLVYVLGGITYAEVATLRLLQKLNDCRVLIASTSLINGNSLMQMMSP